MRTKESSSDYRYFPEPDLPPFTADAAFLRDVESSLVELPAARRQRFVQTLGLGEDQAGFLCEEKETADWFEKAVGLGADPQAAALWMAADVKKHLNRTGLALAHSPLTPERFAELLGLLATRRIHGKIAKAVLEAVFEEDKDPLAVIREKGWEQITDPAILRSHIAAVTAAHAREVAAIRAGDHRPMGYLVGEIMKATSGRADPGLVQSLMKESLTVSVIRILSMGGAIAGRLSAGGDIVAGDSAALVHALEAEGRLPKAVAFSEVELGRILSEEITPEDWARLIAAIDAELRQGSASALVIAHGTDTLAYSASLVYWLFPRPPVPIVFTASLEPPGRAGSDAIPNLRDAIHTAAEREPGVYVVFGGKVLSPLNLKFERVAPDGFRNWNTSRPRHAGVPLFADTALAGDRERLRERFEAAINTSTILRVYPGMRGDQLIGMMDRGIRNFVLELYDTGTASLRESPYSLRRAFAAARERGVRFYCTSQQEGIVDFSGYVTSHELWREGAVPMGSLTTESAWTRLIACLAFSESDEEARARMEKGHADAGI
jgi:aspartyl-tRNA(Asn)/glutamyl-tRNA(Gln) amidotransferase subunit B